jgi:hypothetical protein
MWPVGILPLSFWCGELHRAFVILSEAKMGLFPFENGSFFVEGSLSPEKRHRSEK